MARPRPRLRLVPHQLRYHSSSSPATSTNTTTTPTPSASTLATHFLRTHQLSPPQTTTQHLSAHQLRLFSLTLSRPFLFPLSSPNNPSLLSLPPPPHTPLPPTYHLAFFPPAIQLSSTLSADGTDTAYNAPFPFTRRMWAGGTMRFDPERKGRRLRVGQRVRETTEVRDCRVKRMGGGRGEEMLVVGVRKGFVPEEEGEEGEGVAVEDVREWVFRRGLDEEGRKKVEVPKPPSEPLAKRPVGRHVVQTPETLFRFSALTFNAHRIHYDKEWCQKVEGHRERVVHGPLNLVGMCDFWRDELADGKELVEVRYRATSPVYVGEGYTFVDRGEVVEGEDRGRRRVEVVSDDGRLCMWGVIKGV